MFSNDFSQITYKSRDVQLLLPVFLVRNVFFSEERLLLAAASVVTSIVTFRFHALVILLVYRHRTNSLLWRSHVSTKFPGRSVGDFSVGLLFQSCLTAAV